jgi:hypothetical protein
VRAAEVGDLRQFHAGVCDRALKGREMNAGIADRVLRERREGFPVGLEHIEHVGRSKAEYARHRRLFRVIQCVVAGEDVPPPPRDRREDDDAPFAASDPTTDAAPGLIAGDTSGRGALRRDEKLVVEAVRVKPTRDGEIPGEGRRSGPLSGRVTNLGVRHIGA